MERQLFSTWRNSKLPVRARRNGQNLSSPRPVEKSDREIRADRSIRVSRDINHGTIVRETELSGSGSARHRSPHTFYDGYRSAGHLKAFCVEWNSEQRRA